MPRYSPDFLDELKARLRPSDIIGRQVKLKKQGNEWRGLSPFTAEKTPSFYVNDQKGFFKDFSSGKFGDVITFLQETQKLTFAEAVERLAEEAGMELPKATPQEAAEEKKRLGLAEACAAASEFFQAMLRRGEGRAARDYLDRRGVGAELIETFGIGFAPDNRGALKDHLVNKGFQPDVLVEAGLLIRPEGGGADYDRFRGRVMFPILGPRGRVIAFGGRALSKDVHAKYLNSPETPLFHKGDVLFNFDAARRAAATSNRPLIVCEGYMDVIALTGAGFGEAVAPLGTALTERQLGLLWRAVDEPLLCFDGDRAGTQAAHRSIDRALPLLKPGKSLRFVFLPEGKDPDDMVREEGAPAFGEACAGARPLVDVLWERERDAQPLDTPERRAAFKAHLRDLVKTIGDPDVRGAYGEELAERLTARREAASSSGGSGGERPYGGGGRGGGKGRTPWRNGPVRASAEVQRLRRSAPRSDDRREAALLLAVINHPELADRCEGAFSALSLGAPDLRALHAAILDAFVAEPTLDTEGLKRHLHSSGLADSVERLLSDERLILERYARPGVDIDEAEKGWLSAYALHVHNGALRKEETIAATDLAQRPDARAEIDWRAAVAARLSAVSAQGDGDDDVPEAPVPTFGD